MVLGGFMDKMDEEKIIKKQASTDLDSILATIDKVSSLYSEKNGWMLSEPKITPNIDGRTVTIEILATKVNQQSIKWRSK